MKIESLNRILPVLTKKLFVPGAALLLVTAATMARGQVASELLEKGIYTEETKGELKAASQIYQQIVDDPVADRSLVAQAQLRLGLCELKLGNKPRAISALERLTQEFPDKDKLLALVERQMPQVLDEMLKQIEQNYIQEVDRSELMETAIRAIVGKLDARGGFLRTNDLAFLDTNEMAEINVGIEQKMAGIGARLKFEKENRAVMVETPLPNSPALKSGLLAGDRILAVNGAEFPEGKELETAVKLLRGPAGTPVAVSVKRPSVNDAFELKLTRDTMRLASVLGAHYKPDHTWDFMLDDETKIGYLRVSYIGQQSADEVEAALKELTAHGMRGLVLDLRNGPGGLLDGAVAISDLFVESGRIVTLKSRSGEHLYDAKSEGTFSGFPIAVLVNRNTASAAEIVAACLQDHQRAVVVGERTFGQAVVKNLIQLKNGLGALKLPTGAYYRPSGKNMNRYPGLKDSDDWGVTPDEGYQVMVSEDELKQFEKYQDARTILSNSTAPKIEFQDRQLERALDYIRAQVGHN